MQFTPQSRIATFSDEDDVNAIIETPKGSHNKYDYDEDHGCFKLGGVLPVGAFFPFDFGFVPSTLGEDGDPLDILVLMDEPAFPGCLVPARLLGAIEAEQTERNGETMRNDRLIAVASHSRLQQNVKALDDLNPCLLDQIEHFFASYNQAHGKEFVVRGRADAAHARQFIEEGRRRFENTSK
jgi:inorganic pyrophosphatase